MMLPDVNVLVYAYRDDAPRHARHRLWLAGVLESDEASGLSDLVLSGLLRVVTHPRVFSPPSPLSPALQFVEALRTPLHGLHIGPGQRHWEIFVRLCRESGAKGNVVPDAYLAALALESGSEWMTTDRGYGRFPGLRWKGPGA